MAHYLKNRGERKHERLCYGGAALGAHGAGVGYMGGQCRKKSEEDSKEGDNAIPKEEREMKEAESDYSTEGMCVGMCIGVIIWNLFELAYGLGLGMLIGLTVGSLIKKEKSNREN